LLNENDGLNPILPSKARFKRPLFVRVCFRRLSGQQYISGTRFILEDYQEVTLGNIVAKNERMLDIGGGCYRLTGFIAAVGPEASWPYALRRTKATSRPAWDHGQRTPNSPVMHERDHP
jgi:hypothetical protein